MNFFEGARAGAADRRRPGRFAAAPRVGQRLAGRRPADAGRPRRGRSGGPVSDDRRTQLERASAKRRGARRGDRRISRGRRDRADGDDPPRPLEIHPFARPIPTSSTTLPPIRRSASICAGLTRHADTLAEFRAEVARRWNLAALDADVRASQARRRLVNAALTKGEPRAWDFQPFRDASPRVCAQHHRARRPRGDGAVSPRRQTRALNEAGMGASPEIVAAIAASGLALRGVLTLEPAERTGALTGVASLALLGFVGGQGFDVFTASPEAADNAEHPLDRWSRRVIDASGGGLERASVLSVRRPARLAVSALGAAGRRRSCFADRAAHSCRVRAVAFLSRRARLCLRHRAAGAAETAEPVRNLRRAAVPDDVPSRRVSARRLRRRRLRKLAARARRRRLHGRGLPCAARLSGRRRAPPDGRASRLPHARLSGGEGAFVAAIVDRGRRAQRARLPWCHDTTPLTPNNASPASPSAVPPPPPA